MESLPDPAPADIYKKRTNLVYPQMMDESHVDETLNYTEIPSTPTRIKIDKKSSLKSARKLILQKPEHEGQSPVRRERSRMNGKKAIRMSDSTKKRRRKNVDSDGEIFALRKMEPFVCAFFCEACQEESHYDGEVLSIKTCDRCRSRFVNCKM